MTDFAPDFAPDFAVVLVNYKRADDTIECLESLLRSTLPLRIVVVDNSEGDGSLAAIAAWARGEREPTVASEAMAWASTPPALKPVAVVELTAAEAAATAPADVPLTLIDSGGNRGFAGGNNVGLRHLLRDPGLAYFWLLNNDTVAAPAAAAAIHQRMAATHRIGMCGTQVRFYFRPETVQALNGHRFNRWLGTSGGIGAGSAADAPFDVAQVARDTDFVLGASLCVSRPFLEQVGLMAEDYFLYCEEVDWAYRGAGRFVTAFAHGAVVWHKEGGSIGSSSRPGARSLTSEYYLMRSRLKFVKRHLPAMLPMHWGVAAAQIALRLVRRQPAKAWVMTRALLGLKA